MNAHGIAAPRERVALRIGMIEIENATLADHRVVVELAFQAFPQLHRKFVERNIARFAVIGANDGGVAPGIARTDPALFENLAIAQAMHLCEVIGRGQAMTATS